MKNNKIIEEIRALLKDSVDEKTIQTGQNYFKETIKLYGVKIPIVNNISKLYFETIKNIFSKNEIFALCDDLWQSGYIEESFIACNWSYALCKNYEPVDFEIFNKWVNTYVNNWASCDTLCNHTIGEFLEMYPEFILELKKWATSNNRWLRRAASVSLIIPARKGKFLNDTFEIVNMLLTDKDDLVQKGYGWMLKAASEAHQNEVFNYLMVKKEIMPRTAFRYALEKMPQEMRAKAMRKNK